MVPSALLFLSCIGLQACSLTTIEARRILRVNCCFLLGLFLTAVLGSTSSLIRKMVCLHVSIGAASCRLLFSCGPLVIPVSRCLTSFLRLMIFICRKKRLSWAWFPIDCAARPQYLTLNLAARLLSKKVGVLLLATFVRWRSRPFRSLLYQTSISKVRFWLMKLSIRKLANCWLLPTTS